MGFYYNKYGGPVQNCSEDQKYKANVYYKGKKAADAAAKQSRKGLTTFR